jgi:hypothetical protein
LELERATSFAPHRVIEDDVRASMIWYPDYSGEVKPQRTRSTPVMAASFAAPGD